MRNIYFLFFLIINISGSLFPQNIKLINPYVSGEWECKEEPVDVLFFNNRIITISLSGFVFQTKMDQGDFKTLCKINDKLLRIIDFSGRIVILGEKGLYSEKGDLLKEISEGRDIIKYKKNLLIQTKGSIKNLLNSYVESAEFLIEKDEEIISTKIDNKNLFLLTTKHLYRININNMKVSEKNILNKKIPFVYSPFRDRYLLDFSDNFMLYLTEEKKFCLKNKRKDVPVFEKIMKYPIISIGFWNNNIFVISGFKTELDENKSYFYLFDKKGNQIYPEFIIDYKIRLGISKGNKKEYLYILGEAGIFEIFYKNPQNRFSIRMQGSLAIIRRIRFYDINNDGESDILTTVVSSWENKKNRWKGVGYLLSHIGKARKLISENLKNASEFEKNWKLNRALEFVEAALVMNQFTDPDKHQDYSAIRNGIIKKLRIIYIIKKTIKIILLIIIIGLFIFLFLRFLRKKIYRGFPSDKTLEELSGSLFTHHALYVLRNILETKKEERLPERLEEYRQDFRRLFVHLKKYKKEFSRLSPEWRKCFFSVYSSIRIMKKPSLNRKDIKNVLSVLEDFQKKIRNMRGSIIRNSLNSAINSIIYLVTDKGIRIEDDIISDERTFGIFYPEQLEKFKNAFISILQNAVDSFNKLSFDKFSPIQDPVISISAEEDFDSVYIIIADNGKGISKKNIGKIFERGFTSGKKGGSGIGLSDVRALFEQWGRIDVESEIGKGSVFKIYLKALK